MMKFVLGNIQSSSLCINTKTAAKLPTQNVCTKLILIWKTSRKLHVTMILNNSMFKWHIRAIIEIFSSTISSFVLNDKWRSLIHYDVDCTPVESRRPLGWRILFDSTDIQWTNSATNCFLCRFCVCMHVHTNAKSTQQSIDVTLRKMF